MLHKADKSICYRHSVKNEFPSYIVNLANAGVFALAAGLVNAVALFLLRLGLEFHFETYLASACILAGGAFAPFLLSRRWLMSESLPPAIPAMLSLAFFLTPVLYLYLPPSSILIRTFLAIMAFLAITAFTRAWPFLRFRLRTRTLPVFCAGALIGLYWLVGSDLEYSIYNNEMALLGILGRDNYFHYAIANLLKNYHVASTGADGLFPLSYHYFSHLWFAGISSATGSPVAFVYAIGQAVAVFPLIFYSLLALVLSRARSLDRHFGITIGIVIAFLFIAAQQGGLRTYESQSYVFSLVLLLLTIPLLQDILETPRRGGVQDAIRFALILGITFFSSGVKISTGAVLLSGGVYALLRGNGVLFRGLIGAALMLFVFWQANKAFRGYDISGIITDINLFNMFRTCSRKIGFETCVISGIFGVFPALTLAFLALQHYRIRSFKRLVEAFKRREALVIELGLLMAICAVIPSIFWNLTHTVERYFYFLAAWSTAPLAIVLIRVDLISRAARHIVRLISPAFPVLPKAGLLVGLCFLAFSLQPFRKAYVTTYSLIKHAGWVLRAGDEDAKGEILKGKTGASFYEQSLAEEGVLFGKVLLKSIEEKSVGGRVRSALEFGLGEDRKGIAVFVPPGNQVFWDPWRLNWGWDPWQPLGGAAECFLASPLVIQALVGVPVILGLPPAGRACVFMFGLMARENISKTRDLDDAGLCLLTRERGFERVFILNSVDDRSSNRLLSCKELARG